MNAKERLDAFYAGEKTDRLPNLTIVGSVVTQYTGIDIETYCKDYKAMVRSAILAAHDLSLDYVQIASDLCREAEGYGSQLTFSPAKLPTVTQYALDNILDETKLPVRRCSDIPRLYDMVSATALALEQEKDIYPMTLGVGPATIAGNIRGVEALMMDIYDEPEAVEELLQKVTETLLDYIRQLASVGAKYIYIADPVASLLSPNYYAQTILACHQKLFGEMKRLGIQGRLHMCGNTLATLPHSSQSGAAIIDIDHATDFAAALDAVQDRCVLNGNIDPVADVFSCDAAHTKQAILDCARQAGGKRALFMPGCELPTSTPLANIKAIYQALCEIG